MGKRRLNYDEIQKAMEDVRRDRYDFFLDLETLGVVTVSMAVLEEALSALYGGTSPEYEREVVFDSDVNLDAELSDSCEENLDAALSVLLDGERYLRIPERNAREAFEVMRSFAETVKDGELRRRLLDSLDGRGAFRRFKDVLLSDKRERKRWHGYNAKAMRAVIDGWLQAEAGNRPGRRRRED